MQREIRRDTVRVLRTAATDKHLMLDAAEHLPTYDRPALVVWASEDRVMPPAHGRRLAELLPQGRLVEIPDSYTLMPLDQPARLAQVIRDFNDSVTSTTTRSAELGSSFTHGEDPG